MPRARTWITEACLFTEDLDYVGDNVGAACLTLRTWITVACLFNEDLDYVGDNVGVPAGAPARAKVAAPCGMHLPFRAEPLGWYAVRPPQQGDVGAPARARNSAPCGTHLPSRRSVRLVTRSVRLSNFLKVDGCF